jgi:hypothetical protein
MAMFKDLYYVCGNPLEKVIHKLAGVGKASKAVVLAGMKAHDDAGGLITSASSMIDAEAIFAFQSIKSANPSLHVLVELLNHDNAVFLHPDMDMLAASHVMDDGLFHLSADFASGSVYSSGMVDTMTCQAFYNRSITNIVNALVAPTEARYMEKTGDPDVDGFLRRVSPGMLQQVPIPMDYSRKTYGELFQYLVEKQNAVPLGLYRGVLANDKKTNKPRGNKQPYVFTNPSKDTRLAPEDAVFIIARVSDADTLRGMRATAKVRAIRRTLTVGSGINSIFGSPSKSKLNVSGEGITGATIANIPSKFAL